MENSGTHAILDHLKKKHNINVESEAIIPKPGNTVCKLVLWVFSSHKHIIRTELQSTMLKIHITCNSWNSKSKMAILGVVAHYIAESDKLTDSVTALKEIDGERTCENQAIAISKVVQDYWIMLKLRYFLMNNTPNNNTLVINLLDCEFYLLTIVLLTLP